MTNEEINNLAIKLNARINSFSNNTEEAIKRSNKLERAEIERKGNEATDYKRGMYRNFFVNVRFDENGNVILVERNSIWDYLLMKMKQID